MSSDQKLLLVTREPFHSWKNPHLSNFIEVKAWTLKLSISILIQKVSFSGDFGGRINDGCGEVKPRRPTRPWRPWKIFCACKSCLEMANILRKQNSIFELILRPEKAKNVDSPGAWAGRREDDFKHFCTYAKIIFREIEFTEIFVKTVKITAYCRKTRNSLLLQTVEIKEIYSHWKNISSNHLFSNLFSKTVTFTKYLPKLSESEFPTVWKLREFSLTLFRLTSSKNLTFFSFKLMLISRNFFYFIVSSLKRPVLYFFRPTLIKLEAKAFIGGHQFAQYFEFVESVLKSIMQQLRNLLWRFRTTWGWSWRVCTTWGWIWRSQTTWGRSWGSCTTCHLWERVRR